MKYLYIVDLWIPFPAADTGLVTLIAESDTEAFEILANSEEFDSTYTNLIMPKIMTSQKFALVDDYESGVVEALVV
jgi:hypothetical protein